MRIKYLVLFGLMLLFTDCQKDDLEVQDEVVQSEIISNHISGEGAPDVVNFIDQLFNSESLKLGKINLPFPKKLIDKKTIAKVKDKETGYTTFTFAVKRKKKDNFLFQVAVTKYGKNDFSDPYIFKFKFDDAFRRKLNKGMADWSEYIWPIYPYSLNEAAGALSKDPTPLACPPVEPSGSGGSGTYEPPGYIITAPGPRVGLDTYIIALPTCPPEGCDHEMLNAGSGDDCPDPLEGPIGIIETEDESGSNDPINLVFDAISAIRNTIGYSDPIFENWLEGNVTKTMSLYTSIQSQENKEFNNPLLNNSSHREEYIDHTIRIAADLKRMGYGELAQLVGSFVFPMETALGMTNAEVYKLYESAFEMRQQANLHWKGQIMMAVLDPILEISVIAMEELALNAISGPALGIIAKGLGRTARWTGLSRALARVSANLATNGISGFKYAGRFGVDSYSNLSKVFADLGIKKPDFGPYGVHVHHLIEKRFAATLGVSQGSIKSIVLTPAEHQLFTNAWRAEISTSTSAILHTGNATKAHVEAAARKIYKDYPILLQALGL